MKNITLKMFFLGLLSFCFLGSLPLHAQQFAWAKTISGTNQDISSASVTDASGNVYTIGYFAETSDFNPGAGTFNMTATGTEYDIFVQKLDVNGNFVWAKRMGGTGRDISIGLTNDNADNLYITGYFEGIMDFDPNAGVFNLASVGGRDAFVLKLDKDGNFIWVKSIGGSGQDIAYTVKIDNLGNVIVAGSYEGTADFDPSAGVFNITSSGGAEEVFVLKLNNAGNFIWAKSMGGSGNDYVLGLTVDSANNIYSTGYFNATADFDPGVGVFNLVSAGLSDIFLSKLDANGNFLWAKGMGNVTDNDWGFAVATDASNNVYFTGLFDTLVDFDTGPGVANLSEGSLWSTFICKYDASGNLIWVKKITDNDVGYGTGIVVNSSGVYLVGNFWDRIFFEGDNGTVQLTSNGFYDTYISKFDFDGSFVWARSIGGNINNDRSWSINVDASLNVVIAGRFMGTVDFDPNAGVANTASANNTAFDGFTLKLSPQNEIRVQGNNTTIPDNSTTTNLANHTHFGLTLTTTPIVRTYTIQNKGDAVLNITSITSNNPKFVISGAPTSVARNSQATFNVTYTPTTLTEDNATITINNDDQDEAVYDFAIMGKRVQALPTDERGNMIALDGTNDYINLATNPLSNSTSLTIETWIFPTSNANWARIVDFGNSAGVNMFFTPFNILTGGARFVINVGAGEQVVNSTNIIPLNTWSHLAVTLTGTTATIYVNGIQAGQNTAFNLNPASLGATTNNWIGRSQYVADPYLPARLEELRIWNTARTQNQIRENMHLILTGTEPNLISYYQFNETTGNVIDAMRGNNGTLVNGATRNTSNMAVARGGYHRMNVTTGLNTFANVNLNINFTAAPTDEFVVYQLRGNPVNGVNSAGSASASCYWIVRQFGTNAVAYNQMTFTLPNSNTISTTDETTPNNIKLYKRGDVQTTAFGLPIAGATSASNTTKIVQFTGLTQTGFSQFEIGSSMSVLPITLLSFEGKRQDENKVLLQWKTATETNNAGFEVEMAQNGQDFQKIAFVEGKGNSNTIKNYELEIRNNESGYYRLKQLDFNNDFSYSNIIFIKGFSQEVKMYPNPTSEYLILENIPQNAKVLITDMLGKEIFAIAPKENILPKNTLQINVVNWQKGIYIVKVGKVVKKVVVE